MTFISETTGKSPERQTRERILEAAIRVFSRKGYHDTRVDEIVDESQTSKGAVYFHFPSKEQIFLALVDEFAGLLEKKLLETIQSEGDGVRGVDAALRVGLETFAKYRSLAKIFLIQAVGLGAAFEEKRLQILDRLADVIRSYLDQAVAEGDIPPIDTRITAYAWIGAINEVVIRWVHTGEPSPEQIQPVLRALLLRSIGVPEERIQASPDRISIVWGTGSERMIYSHTVPWPDAGLPVFLRRAAGSRRFLWESERAGVSFAAFGVAATLTASGPDRFRRIRTAAADLLHGHLATWDEGVPPEAARPRFVGGFPFLADPLPGENSADGVWRGFGKAFFALPRYLLSRTEQGSFLTACAAAGANDPWASKEALWDLPAPLDIPVMDFSPTTAPPSDFTTRSSWSVSVHSALTGIAGGRMRKVVLARAREFPAGANPVASLARLSARYPDCFRFLIEPEPGHAFFGATPELLVSKQGRLIETMALAGSSRRGRSLEEDVYLGEQLAASEKDLFEHELVVRSVQGRLAPALGRMEIGERELLRLSNIQHLCTPVTGEVRDGTGLLELVERLHPTPAVGGLPAEAALEFIAAAEPVSRGWYAGPVGWFDGAGDGEFAVALRSAVSDGVRTRLYAGAGIVEGSDPDREWQEIDLKFLPMMEALGCVPNG